MQLYITRIYADTTSIQDIYDEIESRHLGVIDKIVYSVVMAKNGYADAYIYFKEWYGVPEECESVKEGEFISFMPDATKEFVRQIESNRTDEFVPFSKSRLLSSSILPSISPRTSASLTKLQVNTDTWLVKNITETAYTLNFRGNRKFRELVIHEIPGNGKIVAKDIAPIFRCFGVVKNIDIVWTSKNKNPTEILKNGINAQGYVYFESMTDDLTMIKFLEDMDAFGVGTIMYKKDREMLSLIVYDTIYDYIRDTCLYPYGEDKYYIDEDADPYIYNGVAGHHIDKAKIRVRTPNDLYNPYFNWGFNLNNSLKSTDCASGWAWSSKILEEELLPFSGVHIGKFCDTQGFIRMEHESQKRKEHVWVQVKC
jgi:hypothetical protein